MTQSGREPSCAQPDPTSQEELRQTGAVSPSDGAAALLSLPVPFPEHISYEPRLSSATLAGKLTQSTFTLEQPLGQFDHLNLSNADPIWLVVAHSNGGCHCHQALAFPCAVGRWPGRSSGRAGKLGRRELRGRGPGGSSSRPGGTGPQS